MKMRILDAESLRAISPAALTAYARAEGWSRTDVYGPHADVYEGDGRQEIVLPRTDRIGDYASLVSRLISIFAEATGRDELSTYRDLLGADHDVVRVRAIGTDGDGSVPLDAGVEIVTQARNMLLAAACAARSPQPFYRAGANREANDYMRRVRLGQTERGSFVVTLLAPVPPQLQPHLDPTWANLEEEPLERQVTRRLVAALEASRAAVGKALSGDPVAFESAVSCGVSANLCEAVANLVEQSRGLDVRVTWARTRPGPEARRDITFSESEAPILQEAARTFRLRQPKEDVTLFGTVHKLKRDPSEEEGVIALKAMVDDKPQAVNVSLDRANYSIAVRAHDGKAPVIVKGDLVRVGQRWQMTNASVREIPTEDGTDDEELRA